MRVLGLDQSESSCGFALWGPDDAKVLSGTWQLGSEYSSYGSTFAKLHEEVYGLHQVSAIDAIFYEKPRHLDGHNMQSNAHAHFLLVGLAAHIESVGAAMQCRTIKAVHMSTWRAHFLRGMPRVTKTEDLKMSAMAKARRLGFHPRKHDEAEAIGILSYGLDMLGITPPWAADAKAVDTPLFGAVG